MTTRKIQNPVRFYANRVFLCLQINPHPAFNLIPTRRKVRVIFQDASHPVCRKCLFAPAFKSILSLHYPVVLSAASLTMWESNRVNVFHKIRKRRAVI